MGDLLRKMTRLDPETRSRQQIEDVAEGAALMQEQHARDVLSMAEVAGIGGSDVRVQRALAIFERLR
jgi:hypothetical protein